MGDDRLCYWKFIQFGGLESFYFKNRMKTRIILASFALVAFSICEVCRQSEESDRTVKIWNKCEQELQRAQSKCTAKVQECQTMLEKCNRKETKCYYQKSNCQGSNKKLKKRCRKSCQKQKQKCISSIDEWCTKRITKCISKKTSSKCQQVAVVAYKKQTKQNKAYRSLTNTTNEH